MIIAVKKNNGFLKVDLDNEFLRELINEGTARPFQNKEMFWVEPETGEHSANVSDETAAVAIAYFAAQEEEEA